MEDAARPWTAFYGPHVRPEIETASHRILPDLIGGVAETYRSAPAFTCVLPNGMNGTLSFAQVDEMSDALAIYLREVAGLGAGDRVAVQMPNCSASPWPPSPSSRRAACW
jgi:long-chain acyl-CoA synthetase